MPRKARIYKVTKKQILKKSVELELTDRVYLNGSVGLHLELKGADSSTEDLPVKDVMEFEARSHVTLLAEEIKFLAGCLKWKREEDKKRGRNQ